MEILSKKLKTLPGFSLLLIVKYKKREVIRSRNH